MLIALGSSANDRESDIYLSNVRKMEYETMLECAFDNIRLGHNSICSAPFIQEFKDKKWINVIKTKYCSLDYEILKIWVDVDLPTAKARIIDRGCNRDAWKISNWEKYTKVLPKTIPNGARVIDNSCHPKIKLLNAINSVINHILKN